MDQHKVKSEYNPAYYYTILVDILKNWLVILLITVSVGMLVHVKISRDFKPQYTTTCTMIITNVGVDNNLYKNLSSASNAAQRFQQLVNSSVLQKIVAEDSGLESFDGTVKAVNLADSNLLTLTVVASTPQNSFRELQAILNDYTEIAKDLLGDVRFTLLESPKVPTETSNTLNTKPRVVRYMLITAAAIILLLAAMSFIRDTIRTSDDVELKLDTKLLATIYHERKYYTLKSRLKKEKSSILITDPVTSFRYVETMHKMTSRIMNHMKNHSQKTIMVTSIMENEGKTTVAANLALAIAQEGGKVLLIDADFRKPSQHKVLNMQDRDFISLRDILRDKKSEYSFEEMTVQVPGSELRCILNRNAASQSMELLSSSRLRDIISHYKKEMDYIVVDTSPMQMVADAEELADVLDCSIIVVRQHMMESKDINDAIDALNGGHSKVIGCAFNDVHSGYLNIFGTSGYGHYGYGYGYGGHYER